MSATRDEGRILEIIETARGKRAKFRDEHVNMAHGAGGKATQGMIEGLFAPAFGAQATEDAASLEVDGAALAFTTDSFVVKPLRFPGGSIGDLAVNGTVNDLAVSGARPLALSLSLILEEGLTSEELRAEVEAIAGAAERAGVQIVTGDTKVVERGAADGMYVCTAGVGSRDPRATPRRRLDPARRPRAAVRHDRRARHGHHARPRGVRARRSRRVGHALAVAGRRRTAGGGRAARCAACATRRAAAWLRC